MLPEDTEKAKAITTINQRKRKVLITRARGLNKFSTKTIGHPENILGGHFFGEALAEANSSAIPRPIPAAAPVTIAI